MYEMNILVIDYLSYKGHRFFNRIHIQALLSLGHKLTLVGKDGQFDEYKESIKTIDIPNKKQRLVDYYVFRDVSNLNWIKKHIEFDNYDIIIVPTYDILSFSFFRISKKVFIVNHNNISLFTESKIGKMRLCLTKFLPKNYTHICLSTLMKEHLQKLLPSKDVVFVPHGLCKASSDQLKPDFVSKDESFIFCPVNRNFDREALVAILNSKVLHAKLKELNLKLYIKDILPYSDKCDMIVKISGMLSRAEYNYMLQNSKAVILPYGKQFGYRCSGILFESISNDTHVIASNIEAMKVYADKASISFYDGVDDFCSCLNECINIKVHNNLELFNPLIHWEKILK
ncbi:hypothetical protein ACTMKN_12320 [Bacteroides pyogenes]|uniref:glycosyltransferase family 4 protein n=1 Tax=Bacteroides pyogenes TaxID=310300 RepID=UPI0011E3F7C4|nr:glycosyltransferase family 4 protein [Bacteroides pyogenes]TYK38354.1 glycosyltransferase family 4 protein [Bacteroides pyogenes]